MTDAEYYQLMWALIIASMTARLPVSLVLLGFFGHWTQRVRYVLLGLGVAGGALHSAILFASYSPAEIREFLMHTSPSFAWAIALLIVSAEMVVLAPLTLWRIKTKPFALVRTFFGNTKLLRCSGGGYARPVRI